MLWAAVRYTRGGADDKGHGAGKHELDLGTLIDYLVHSAEGKVDEVQVDDRVQASQSGADARRYHCRLGNGRVENPPGADQFSQALYLSPVAAPVDQVGPQHENVWVGRHLLGDSLGESGRIS